MSSFLVTLRRLRDDRVPTFGIAFVVLVTATVFALAPRLLERVGDDAFRGVARQATAFNRNIALIEEQPGYEAYAIDRDLRATWTTGFDALCAR
jgi:hypothetical protein